MHKMIMIIKAVGKKDVKVYPKDLQDVNNKLHSHLSNNGPDVNFEIRGKAYIVSELKFER